MMYVRTIWRAFAANVDVWTCEPCGKTERHVASETKH